MKTIENDAKLFSYSFVSSRMTVKQNLKICKANAKKRRNKKCTRVLTCYVTDVLPNARDASRRQSSMQNTVHVLWLRCTAIVFGRQCISEMERQRDFPICCFYSVSFGDRFCSHIVFQPNNFKSISRLNVPHVDGFSCVSVSLMSINGTTISSILCFVVVVFSLLFFFVVAPS